MISPIIEVYINYSFVNKPFIDFTTSTLQFFDDYVYSFLRQGQIDIRITMNVRVELLYMLLELNLALL